ncbi:MAG: amino acid ABC transporter permease [Caldilineaceae bacterium]|nr:amino acid ABC transporter permease [Caldilineaceae bacterium]MCB9139593.1 amino acid ABC transporter permease [Caldilineaceae bacterium]
MTYHSAPRRPGQQRSRLGELAHRTPYWLVATIGLGIFFLYKILTADVYNVIFRALLKGVGVTLYVTLFAFVGAMIVGLLLGMARLTKNRFLQEVTSFYVEIVRGVPMLVLLYYIVFVGAPSLVGVINRLGDGLLAVGVNGLGSAWSAMSVRDLSFATRAILALIVGYSAFISEIFRAGIQSIGRGQSEAAMSLGMNRRQTMTHIILPQAVRRVLPPLGNDFIAMLKDSALVSVVGVPDITRLGNTYAASTFRFLETYNVVAFLYLTMTIALALGVRYLERRMSESDK